MTEGWSLVGASKPKTMEAAIHYIDRSDHWCDDKILHKMDLPRPAELELYYELAN